MLCAWHQHRRCAGSFSKFPSRNLEFDRWSAAGRVRSSSRHCHHILHRAVPHTDLQPAPESGRTSFDSAQDNLHREASDMEGTFGRGMPYICCRDSHRQGVTTTTDAEAVPGANTSSSTTTLLPGWTTARVRLQQMQQQEWHDTEGGDVLEATATAMSPVPPTRDEARRGDDDWSTGHGACMHTH